MRKVTAWEAADGSLHMSANEAYQADKRTEFASYYDEHRIKPIGSNVPVDIVTSWLRDNKEAILKYIGGL